MTENPRDVLQRIYDTEFGLRPTNFSIKPVHVANGLGRSLTGRSYQSTALAETLRRWVRIQKVGSQEERNPNSAILERYGGAFASRDGDVIDNATLSVLRKLAFDVLGTDGAVFPDSDMSSYTLSNERFITRDLSDNRCGLFLARLLTSGVDGDAANHIRLILTTDDDPWTTLALPMLQFAEPREEVLDGEVAVFAARADHLFARRRDKRLVSPILQTMREAFDRLARFEHTKGSKLNSLRRLVMFGCFVVHVHVCSRASEAMPGTQRPPILLDMFDGTRPSLRDASRATLRAAGDAVEVLLSMRMREHFAEVDAVSEAKRIIAYTNLKDDAHADLRAAFDAYRQDGAVPVSEALAEAFLQSGFSMTRGHPIGFLTELGRRAGYLTPWANQGRGGKLQKRYGLTTEFLETLIAATVEPDRPLEFPEFLDVLRDSFGIVVGRRVDDAVIRANNLTGEPVGTPISVAEEDLRLNVEALRHAVLDSGYAKAYADGQTVVTTDPENMAVL